MQEIIKSTLLEYEKSTFLLDIVKHHSGQGYINIQQTITGDDNKQELKINQSRQSVIAVSKKDLTPGQVEELRHLFKSLKGIKVRLK